MEVTLPKSRSTYERTVYFEAILGRTVAWLLWLGVIGGIIISCLGVTPAWKGVVIILTCLIGAQMSHKCEYKAEGELKDIWAVEQGIVPPVEKVDR